MLYGRDKFLFSPCLKGDDILRNISWFLLEQGWANYGPSNAFLWPAKNLYEAKTLPLFSFSNRLIPYQRIIDM